MFIKILIPFLLLVEPVNAHSGSHIEFNISTILDHMLSSPYHILGIGLILAAVIVVWKVTRVTKR